MDRIDDFFKKHLQEQSNIEEDWNMPSEELWEKALPHFPKKKKRKLIGFWLYGAFALLFLSFMVCWTIYHTINNTDSLLKKELTHSSQHIEKNQLEECDNSVEEKPKVANASYLSSTNEKAKYAPDTVARKKLLKGKESLTNRKGKNNNESSALAPLIKQPIKEQIFIEDKSKLRLPSSEQISQEEVEQIGNKVEDFAIINKSRDTLENIKRLSFNIDNSESIISLDINNPIIKLKRRSPKAEIGLSYHSSLFSLINYVEVSQNSEAEEFTFTSKYRSIAAHYDKWIGDKWSLSSGLQLTELEFDLGLETEITYEDNGLEESIKEEVTSSVSRYNVSEESSLGIGIFDESNGESINIVSNIQSLSNGDTIHLKAILGIPIQIAQLPLLLNYHFYKKRLEYSLGIGAGLNFIRFRPLKYDFELFKQQELLYKNTEAVNVNAISVDYSLWSQASMRYYLNDNFNVGIALRYSISDPIFSSASIGLYYRWR